MSKDYFLSKNGNHVGPYTFEDVLKTLERQEVQWVDYVYDSKIGEWQMLLEHSEFSKILNGRPAERPVTKPADKNGNVADVDSTIEDLKDKEWYIMKNDNKLGPFCYLDLVQMLQAKTLSEFDFVWHVKLSGWKAVADLEDFKPAAIKALKDFPDQAVSEIFFRRRHARASYAASLIIHDNKKVFKGEVIEISAGGAGIFINNDTFKVGQSLFLHFQSGEGVPPFNAICEIANKRFINSGASSVEKVRYGVKFTSITQSVKEKILQFTGEKEAS
jgi:hypothetical protein